jgi:uncharacterized protein (TIGR00725 family)
VIIAVIGGGQAPADVLRQAEVVGRELAANGCVLICGGHGGVMEAACRGAAEAGGLTIGLMPEEDRSGANPYVRIPIVTGIGIARNRSIVLSADAVIAIDGGYGTLSEIAYALQAGKPVVGLGTWRITSKGIEDDAIVRVDDPVEAVKLAMEAAGRGRPHPNPLPAREWGSGGVERH